MITYSDNDTLQIMSADVAILLAEMSFNYIKNTKDLFSSRAHRFENEWSSETSYPLAWAVFDLSLDVDLQDICLQEAVRATASFFQQSDNLYAQKKYVEFFLGKRNETFSRLEKMSMVLSDADKNSLSDLLERHRELAETCQRKNNTERDENMIAQLNSLKRDVMTIVKKNAISEAVVRDQVGACFRDFFARVARVVRAEQVQIPSLASGANSTDDVPVLSGTVRDNILRARKDIGNDGSVVRASGAVTP